MRQIQQRTRTAMRLAALGLICVALSPGCGPRKTTLATYHDVNMDFGVVQTVAVMPFANLTNEARAGGRVRDMFMTVFQSTGAAYVLPPGEVGRGISRLKIEHPEEPTPEDAVALATNVGADAIITGTVLEYGSVRSGTSSANILSVSVKMMEGTQMLVAATNTASRPSDRPRAAPVVVRPEAYARVAPPSMIAPMKQPSRRPAVFAGTSAEFRRRAKRL
jgi:hypothetical protein